MKLNKISYFLLMAAIVCGFSLITASCSDDKHADEKIGQQTEQEVEQDLADAAEFWNVVGQLTDDVMPDEGWQTATYAPSIGEADGTNTTVRIVSTTDVESAAESFADLVGLTMGDGFSADTQEYTYKNNLVGTLTYRRNSGETLATVDVDIAQMPGLQQIVYRQVVDNGSFAGTAYYRFGDIVSKQNADGQTDYWICVRPCFGLANKGDSHWISLSKLPSTNVKTVNKIVNGQRLTHIIPKSLSTNQTHMQNLAEMLYAMLFPDQWARNLKDNDGYKTLKYFKDFDYVHLFDYHNEEFFRNVATAWGDRFVTLFGMTADELRQELQTNGLNLIYSTATMSSNNILLPMATFSGTNLKTKAQSRKSSTWDSRSFDIYEQTADGYLTFDNATGGAQHAWVVRYATGATLAKGSAESPVFDKYKRLPNCRDVFVYNINVAHLDMNNLKNINPQIAVSMFTGTGHYKLGQVYKDEKGHRWTVVYMSGQGEDNPMFTERDNKEAAPYCELVSFDGLTASGDRSYVTNLPTYNQTIRGVYRLAILFGNVATLKDNDLGEFGRGKFVKDVRDASGVDLRKLFQTVKAVSGSPRNASLHASVAYRDPAINYAQPLIRFLRLIDLDNANPPYYLRTVYPLNPDRESQTYPAGSFSTTPVLLQDVADAAKVARYATDLYAWRPITSTTGGDNETNRECRTQADPRANDVTNYYYDQAVWNNYQYPLDMWNAPVLMFRYTAVYDRGDNDYETKTIDGHTLKLIKESSYVSSAEDQQDLLENLATAYGVCTGTDAELFSTTNHLNGVAPAMPSWRDAWGQ